MDQLLHDRDKYLKTTHHFFQTEIERGAHEMSARACSQVKDQIVQALDSALADGNAKMAENSAILRNTVNGPEAERLCRTTVLDKQTLAQRVLQSVLVHLCENNGFKIPPVRREFMIEPITLDSDTDDGEGNEVSDNAAAVQADTRSATGNNNPPRKRTRDDRPNAPGSRARRARRDDDLPPDHAYDGPEPETNTNSTSIATIQGYEVEGLDFIFQYPAVGPGYYVVQCQSPGHDDEHCFKEDPLQLRGRKEPRCVMVRHFADPSPTPRFTVDQIMRRFGRRVVDAEDADVTDEWVENSNRRLASDAAKSSKKKQPGGKQKAPVAPSPVAPSPAAPSPAAPPRWPPTPGYDPCTGRGGISPLSSEPSPAPPEAESEAAGPSRNRVSVPVADMDMDFGDMWAAQAANTNHASWDQAGESVYMPPVWPES
ncbi:uncharacterized protein B0H64DRAFT_229198 [Chaetomium fimeti]|uniref:Uncharacterized protein n=1 Tax=Chaetomium fimeti TaxID=1854472 RepID=A0AAE0LNZ0_9PEZI|nr:hypothetical protein B0H64DRAFT_229198 [Chaetomium fimeti]